METAGKTLLFDPFITPNALAGAISLDRVKADYILISHGHFDHIADAVELAQKTGATVISNFELVSWPGGKGVENAEGAFYFAGDTALTLDLKLIGREFDLSFAVLPIDDNLTMGAKDATLAADFLKCRKVIGVHYDTFPLIKIDHTAAVKTFKSAKLKLFLPPIGSSLDL